MENLSVGVIAGLVIAGILAVASFINSVGSAIEKLVKMWKTAKAPNDLQNDRLDQVENDIKILKGYADSDNRRLKALEDGRRIEMRVLLALLSHGIDGNNIKQMEDSRTELETFLINQ